MGSATAFEALGDCLTCKMSKMTSALHHFEMAGALMIPITSGLSLSLVWSGSPVVPPTDL